MSEDGSRRVDENALIRVWSTISLEEPPDVVAEDAAKQHRLWEATGEERDPRFDTRFGERYSNADLMVVGRERDLLPILVDLAHRGWRFQVDADTKENADRLDALHGEGGSGEWVLALVGHDPSGYWSLPVPHPPRGRA